MRLLHILETSIYVNDLETAAAFYAHILGLQEIGREEGRHVFFRCGPGVLLLFNPQKTRESGDDVPSHGAEGPGHVAFAIPTDEVERWRQHLVAQGITIEREIVWPHGGHSLYFRDPAGNSLELATPALWQFDREDEGSY